MHLSLDSLSEPPSHRCLIAAAATTQRLHLTGIPAPSRDTERVAAAVVGAEGAGRAEWARVPSPRAPSESAAPRGPARPRILSYRSPARRLLLQRGREMPTGEQ